MVFNAVVFVSRKDVILVIDRARLRSRLAVYVEVELYEKSLE